MPYAVCVCVTIVVNEWKEILIENENWNVALELSFHFAQDTVGIEMIVG